MLPCFGCPDHVLGMHRVRKNNINDINVRVILDAVKVLIVIDILVRDIVFAFPRIDLGRSAGDNTGQITIVGLFQGRCQLSPCIITQPYQGDT